MSVEQISPGDPAQLAARLRMAFEAAYGALPAAVYAAPGRVNLIGEHVDYNDGRCLPLALPHATYAAMSTRSDGVLRLTSTREDERWSGHVEDLGPGRTEGWVSYAAGVVWALREQGVDCPGLDILVDSTVPVGAGLSSSAAIECAVAVGVCDLAGLTVGDRVRRDLVRACMRAEAEVAGAPTGGMDQTISLLGREGHALLLDCRDWTTEQISWEPGAEGLALLVVDTRAKHELTDGGYAARRADCEEAASLLGVSTLREVDEPDRALSQLTDDRLRRRTRHVLTEMQRVSSAVERLGAKDYAALGVLLDASHASLRDDYEVSCAELDVVVESSRAAGALGARMTGGGFGGSAIALVRYDAVDRVSRAVAEAFDTSGWPAPGFLVAEPSAGAAKVG